MNSKIYKNLITSWALYSFFYWQLWAAMCAQGVPWGANLEIHPLHSILGTKDKNNFNNLDKFITKTSYKPLPLNRLRMSDINTLSDLDWHIIWSNISLSSRNQNHQMIHYKFIHRSYLTPCRLQQMKLRANPFCDFCSDNTIGTFLHMVWQCPEVNRFWENVSSIIKYQPCLLKMTFIYF